MGGSIINELWMHMEYMFIGTGIMGGSALQKATNETWKNIAETLLDIPKNVKDGGNHIPFVFDII